MTQDNTITSKDIPQIEAIVQELLKQLEVEGSATVSIADDFIDVSLETPDSGIVIGYHGEVLEALQLLLSLMIAKKLGSYHRVSVEVGDYKKNRTTYLERLAQETRERVLEDNREHTISQLKSWERRIIHMLLQNDDAVTSESVGEGKDRVLVVKPR